MGAHLQGEEKSQYVQQMFGRIAKRYNLMNRIMTMGQDQRWRRFVISKAHLPSNGRLLDLATGTGDIAFEAVKQDATIKAIGVDFALPMMLVGQREQHGHLIDWCAADAMQLPFRDNTFDAVTSGFLVRNVIDIHQTLKEQLRVLKPGGRIVILDSSPPPPGLLKPLIQLHLKYGIPLLGRIIAGKDAADAYRYLPESTALFKTPGELLDIMRMVGIQQATYQNFMFGTISVHWGVKQLD